ncbi:hypothetical protein AB0F13_15325 [Streptomyces sp. NPDC026206]|uniref:hypothetical protein n=1 Tax=Streptomyces sp. NPDC026206 TaxID=3157089 RepID=UPI0033C97C2F
MSTQHHYTPFGGEIEQGVKYAVQWKADPRYVLCGHATEGFVDVRDRGTVTEHHYAWHIDTATGVVTLAADAGEHVPRVLTLLLGPAGHSPVLRRLATPADRTQRWNWTGRALMSHRHSTADKLAVHVGRKSGDGSYGITMVLPANGAPAHEWQLLKAPA